MSKVPGQIVQMRIPTDERSRATGSVIPTIAPFDAEYAVSGLEPSCARKYTAGQSTHKIPGIISMPDSIDTSCREVRPGIHVMPLRTPTLPPARHTNCLFVGGAQLFVVDPAPIAAEEQQRLTEQLEHWMRDGTQLAAVLLTHSHSDHIGSAALLRDRYGVPIWAQEATAEQVDFPIDRLLRDDEMISIPGDPGWRLRCLHTPGHDLGHLCFLEEFGATLICGDMVAAQSSIVIPHGRGGDMSAYLDSLERLLRVDCDLMIPSHGSELTKPKKIIQAQIDHRLARERKIQAALDAGARGMDELLAASYDDVPRDLWKLASRTLKAHLVRLGVEDFDE